MHKSLLVAFLTATIVFGFGLINILNFGTVHASAENSNIPKPSIPEFTLELVGPSYYEPTTYSLDSSTGEIVAQIGYRNEYSALLINVTCQSFTPFTDSSGNNIGFYYNVRFKDHTSTGSWDEVYHAWNYFPRQSTGSDFTNVGFSIEGENMGVRVLAGTQIDIQVEAMIGYVHRDASIAFVPWVFSGELSGWSETQTISVPANTPLSSTESQLPSPSQSPTPAPFIEPQQADQTIIIIGVAIIVAVLVVGLSFLFYLIKRK